MKRWIALLCAVILCLSTCGCSNDSSDKKNDHTKPTDSSIADNGNGDNDENTAGSTTDTNWLVDGWIINAVKIRNDVQIVELTTDNWSEHFKVYHCPYRYDEEIVEKDAFGDVISTETITLEYDGKAFGAGNEKYHFYNSVLIELKDKSSGVLTIYEFSSTSNDMFLEEDLHLNNYECTRIKGSIYYWDYPIGTIPIGTMFSPFEGSVDGMPYPIGLEALPGTNAISYSEMGWII